MLSPIPRRILQDTLTLNVPTAFDRYQTPTLPESPYVVKNVHFQGDNTTKLSTQNSEVTLAGIIFIDSRYSKPALDYEALQEAAQAAGGEMTATITGKRGGTIGPFRVVTVDGLPDDEDNLHHWEIGVV